MCNSGKHPSIWDKLSSGFGKAKSYFLKKNEDHLGDDNPPNMPVYAVAKKEEYPLLVGEVAIPEDTQAQIDTFKMSVGYPPKLEGFPARLSGRQLLEKTQRDMVRMIRKEVQLGDDFEKYIMPLLLNVADFVHLFPASEHHHHRAQGGLLRHNLEVCYHAVKAMKVIEFDEKENPEQKSRMVIKWRLAVVVTALLHDIGKPVTDYEIWNKDGTLQWKPSGKCIFEWAVENGIDRYYLSWNKNRLNNHKLLASSLIEKIVPAEVIEILQQNSRNIFFKVVDAISNLTPTDAQKRSNALIELVINADKKSVLEDMQRTSGDAIRSAGTGVSTIQRMVDIMRLLISTNEWKPNVPPSPIWVTTDGIYVIWQKAAEVIYNRIKELGVFIPQSADSLGEIMLSNELIEEGENGSIYWKVIPEKILAENRLPTQFIKEPPMFMYCLKLKSPDTLFSDVLQPMPTTAYVKKAEKWMKYEPTARSENVPENVPEVNTNIDPTESNGPTKNKKEKDIFITEEATEETILGLLSGLGVLEDAIPETEKKPESELTPISASPALSPIPSAMAPKTELKLKTPTSNTMTNKTPSLTALEVKPSTQKHKVSLSLGEPTHANDISKTNPTKTTLIADKKAKDKQVAVKKNNAEQTSVQQLEAEQPKMEKTFTSIGTISLNGQNQHTNLYRQVPLRYREAFENHILSMGKEELLKSINQNHFLCSEKLIFPNEWLSNMALTEQGTPLTVMRSKRYYISNRKILDDIYIITKYIEIKELLELTEDERKITPDSLRKTIQAHSSSEKNKVNVLNKDGMYLAAKALNVSEKVLLKLIAIHFDSYLRNHNLRVIVKDE
ncbi:MobH family relaxase [Xenorhabdus sp. TH1]|uniref:MobH family relaxase n=1 Tax=Xenorhabdus sp. TH1 TaxID=3130166 RepID=UPI0030D1E7D4